MRILLASASPRRRELLEQIGLSFEVVVSHVEEVITETEPGKVVEQLSAQKAEAVAGSLGGPEERQKIRSLASRQMPQRLRRCCGCWPGEPMRCTRA